MVEFAGSRGGHSVAVIVVPTVVGRRFFHFSKDSELSWTIRDYICGYWMEGRENQDRSAQEIEDAAIHFVPAIDIPHESVDLSLLWNGFLTQRSADVLGDGFDFDNPPNLTFGTWKRFPQI